MKWELTYSACRSTRAMQKDKTQDSSFKKKNKCQCNVQDCDFTYILCFNVAFYNFIHKNGTVRDQKKKKKLKKGLNTELWDDGTSILPEPEIIIIKKRKRKHWRWLFHLRDEKLTRKQEKKPLQYKLCRRQIWRTSRTLNLPSGLINI